MLPDPIVIRGIVLPYDFRPVLNLTLKTDTEVQMYAMTSIPAIRTYRRSLVLT